MSGRKREGEGAEDLTRQDIETIIDIVKSVPDVTEFSLKYGKTEIYISRGAKTSTRTEPREAEHQASNAPAWPPVDAAAAVEAVASPMIEQTTAPAPRSNEIVVEAPMVGTFYRAPAPGEAPFVSLGEAVATGAVLCIIEVMKLMNSIAAPRAGVVREILVDDGEAVEFGQPLLIIEVDE
jgi:acetyl-CoA carboxylase biotin carboxyl carrier protein